MNIKIKLDDPERCVGCRCLVCKPIYAGESTGGPMYDYICSCTILDIRISKQSNDAFLERPQECIDEHGE